MKPDTLWVKDQVVPFLSGSYSQPGGALTQFSEHIDFYGMPLGSVQPLYTDEFGFTTVIRVPGGWIFRLHKLRGNEMTSEVIQGIFVPEEDKGH
jgi:hypothetical protein